MTVGTRIAIRSRLQKHFKILTDGSRRTAAGWTCLIFVFLLPPGPREAPPLFWQTGQKIFVSLLPFFWSAPLGRPGLPYRNPDGLAPAAAPMGTQKETYSLTPRGGFFDGRNQNRDSEPSAKPPRNSDKPTHLEILFFVIGSSTMSGEQPPRNSGGLAPRHRLRRNSKKYVY